MASWLDLQCILFFGSALITILLIAFYICTKAITTPHPVVMRLDEEKYFLDSATNTKALFPTIDDEPSIDLSVVVPAYDEENRLPAMFDECLEYLESKSANGNFTYEIIVVSDGSHDNTVSIAQSYAKKIGSEKIRVLSLINNRGKGGAVRLGMQSTRGKFLLFADADGATKFSDLDKLLEEMEKLAPTWHSEAIVIGSRSHLEENSIATRSFLRTILMHGFHFLVWLFAVRKIRDTQCGFKLLSRSAAKILFEIMHVERWAFDVELLFIAQTLKMPIKEVAVTWTEIEGSKLTPFWSSIQMGKDLFLIWFRYTIGAWALETKRKRKLHES